MTGGIYMNYDIVIIGAGPGGIFSAYEAIKQQETRWNSAIARSTA